MLTFGVSKVNCPNVQGPPLALEGSPGQALSPHIKNTPGGSFRGSAAPRDLLVAVLLHQRDAFLNKGFSGVMSCPSVP